MYQTPSLKSVAGNFVEDVVPDLGFELTLPYIMYRNKADEVLLPCLDVCMCACVLVHVCAWPKFVKLVHL